MTEELKPCRAVKAKEQPTDQIIFCARCLSIFHLTTECPKPNGEIMQVLKYTTADGRIFLQQVGSETVKVELVEMTPEEYGRTPATVESAAFFAKR